MPETARRGRATQLIYCLASIIIIEFRESGEAMQDDKTLASKKIIVSDMDGTLTDIKCDLEKSMSDVIAALLEYKELAVIGGGMYTQFRKQFVAHLECPTDRLSKIYLFP